MSSIRALRPLLASLRTVRASGIVARSPLVLRASPAATFSRFTPTRGLSSSPSLFGQGETDLSLSQKLEEEIRYEQESASASETSEEHEFLIAFQKEGVWEIEDKLGNDEVTLIRKFGNETIRILFSIADIDASQETEFETEEGAEHEEEATPSSSTPLRCSITITKPGQAGAVTVDALAQEGSFIVENISYYNDSKLATDLTAEADWKRRGLYIGPRFDHLDAEVQEEFEKYLDERGIGPNLAIFIPQYAEHKEQKEYVKWLQGVKGFIDA